MRRLADAESQLEGQQGKVSSLEKQKSRLQGELEDLMIEVERSQAVAANAEKQQRSFDKTIDEWKRKVSTAVPPARRNLIFSQWQASAMVNEWCDVTPLVCCRRSLTSKPSSIAPTLTVAPAPPRSTSSSRRSTRRTRLLRRCAERTRTCRVRTRTSISLADA